MKDCKIIQDLLPSYIDGLTNKETNLYIEEHLESCSQCKEIYENMKKDIELNNVKKDNREVKYIKKFNNKMRILKLIIAVILIAFIAVIGRRFIIIKSIQNKTSKYDNMTNMKIESTMYRGDTLEITRGYFKDGEYLANYKLVNENTNTELISTSKGNAYMTVDGGKKIAFLNSSVPQFSKTIINYLETENVWQLIFNIFTTNISTVKCNDKDCYKIDGFKSPDVLYPDHGLSLYIDKDTGLIVRIEQGIIYGKDVISTVTDYKYEFDVVTDKDLEEPDISMYEIQNIEK